jgi:hypothetical protein
MKLGKSTGGTHSVGNISGITKPRSIRRIDVVPESNERFVEQTGLTPRRRLPARRWGRQRSGAHDGTKLGLKRLGRRSPQTVEFNDTENRQRGSQLTLTGQFPRAVEQIGP